MIISRNDGPRLPEEIIEDILVRLPFKSIFRFRCVCKSWFNLIKTSSSICNHLKESDVSFIPLCFIHKSMQNWSLSIFLFHDAADDDDYDFEDKHGSNDCLTRFRKGIRIWLNALSDSRKLDARYPLPVLNFKFPFSNRPSLKYKSGLKLVRHCNGIMCLSHPDFILLVNPLLKEVKTLPNPIHDPPRLVGFGFDNIKSMDFKLVRLYHRQREAEVYSLKTNVWRKTAFPFAFLGCIKRSTFFNGVIHWCVEGLDGAVFRWRMLTFNLATHLFELIDFPLNWNHGLPMRNKKPPIGLFVLNQDSLAFVNYASSCSTTSVGVWTLNKHEETTTWTKLYGIEIMAEPLKKPISFWKKDKLLCETNSGRLVLYDLLTRRLSLVFDPSQVSPHNMGYYSEICLEVKAGVLCRSSLVSMNM